MSESPGLHPYDQGYYDAYHTEMGPVPYVRERGPWLRLFRAMAEYIQRSIKPKTVLDVGCAKGFLVEALRDREIEAYGIDISEYAIGEVRPDIRPYCRVASISSPLSHRYDLITCIEVLEHLPEVDAIRAIANMCQAADDILFSSTPDDFDEPTHVNVRPRSYWVERFQECGFSLDADFDPKAIAPHAMRFVKVRPQRHPVDTLLELRDRLKNDMESLNLTVKTTADRVGNLRLRLEIMEDSLGWRVLEKIRKVRDAMLPPDTYRARAYTELRRIPHAIFDEGFTGGIKQVCKSMVHIVSLPVEKEKCESDRHEKPVIFKEHELAHEVLDGLTGLEIGPAAHNPFGLRTRNVELMESQEFYASIQENVMRVTPPKINIWASADRIPLGDQSEDFILSSHVVEHLPNLIAAFLEWDRIVRDGGYVFMIVPHPWALPADKDRALTPVEHFIDDYHRSHSLETHPIEGVPGGKMGHYHTFAPDSVVQLVDWMCQKKLCNWELVAREDIDTKVGNGFTLAYKVRHAAMRSQ
jgi:SAM-dependent methyltransferase